MTFSAQDVFQDLFEYHGSLPLVGTLQALQRAVLLKGIRTLEREGHWPIVEIPLAVHRALGGEPGVALVVAGCCILFYAFADVTDDAQDHDLASDPWQEWGWEQAVNTGSSLLFASLQYLYDRLEPSIAGQVASVFIRAGGLMTQGQHVDLEGQATAIPSIQRYLQMAEWKSGASIGAYMEAMALAQGHGDRAAEFRRLGMSLGAMFQMMSDLYELWGERISPDFSNRRLSFPIILGLEQAAGSQRERLLALLSGPVSFGNQAELVQALEACGVRAYSTLRIEVYRRQANELAERLGVENEPYLRRMLDLPAFPRNAIAL